MGALGNLRHDSALMGAISSTKGKVAMPAVVPVSHLSAHLMYCTLAAYESASVRTSELQYGASG